MEPDHCDDWRSDLLEDPVAITDRLAYLAKNLWQGQSIDRIKRYDDVRQGDHTFNGWAMWRKPLPPD